MIRAKLEIFLTNVEILLLNPGMGVKKTLIIEFLDI